jgi:hypothetical protein
VELTFTRNSDYNAFFRMETHLPFSLLAYINDLPEAASSSARLFADDCLLFRRIRKIQDAVEAVALVLVVHLPRFLLRKPRVLEAFSIVSLMPDFLQMIAYYSAASERSKMQ